MDRRVSSFLLLVLLLAPAPALSNKEEPSTVVTWKQWGPYVDENLPGQGIATTIAREAFSAIGRDVDTQFYPWNRAYEEARSGNHLAAFPYAYNKERNQDFVFTEPLFNSTVRLFTARDQITPGIGFDGMHKPTICLPQGYNTEVAENLFETTDVILERPQEMVNCLLMTKLGRVHFTLVSERVGWFMIDDHPEMKRDDFRLMGFSKDTPVHIIIPRSLEDADTIARDLNQVLREMKTSGRIEEIFDQYQSDLEDS